MYIYLQQEYETFRNTFDTTTYNEDYVSKGSESDLENFRCSVYLSF